MEKIIVTILGVMLILLLGFGLIGTYLHERGRSKGEPKYHWLLIRGRIKKPVELNLL